MKSKNKMNMLPIDNTPLIKIAFSTVNSCLKPRTTIAISSNMLEVNIKSLIFIEYSELNDISKSRKFEASEIVEMSK